MIQVSRTTFVAALLIVAAVTACPEKSSIWVIPGSTVERLEFGVGKSRNDSGGFWTSVVRVYRCDGPSAGPGADWVVHADTTKFPRLKRVIYGEVPPGWATGEGPAPLTPGCYRAAISGTGKTEFHVQPDGGITERQAD